MTISVGNCPTFLKMLGILGIVFGTTLILAGFGTLIGAFSQIPQTPDALYSFRMTVAKFFIIGLASIVLAAGVIEGKRWAWFGTFGLATLAFLKFPIGTVGGIWLILYLFRSSVRTFFRIGMPGFPFKGSQP